MARTVFWAFISLLLFAGSARAQPAGQAKPTAPLREKHRQLQGELEEMKQKVAEIPAADPRRQRELMQEITGFLKSDVAEHAKWEEENLYAAVDRRVESERPFTSTMREEHDIIERRIQELDRRAQRAGREYARSFARDAYALFGVIDTHFEKEETVLLPILDRSMTREQFEREVMGAAPPARVPRRS